MLSLKYFRGSNANGRDTFAPFQNLPDEGVEVFNGINLLMSPLKAPNMRFQWAEGQENHATISTCFSLPKTLARPTEIQASAVLGFRNRGLVTNVFDANYTKLIA